ncbi:MAG: DUF2470 domain-containing protein [Myxococcota bacterium]
MDAHARPATEEPLTPPDVRAPTHGERARTLLLGKTTGALATVSPEGYPHGSFVTFALHAGDPVFLVSTLATHTKHLMKNPRASLLVFEDTQPDPLANGRVTLLGDARRLEDPGPARETFLAAHPQAAYYADFRDFAFWTLAVKELRYIGGYGRMSWVPLEDWQAAEPDPLAAHAEGMIQHMNEDHADACVAYARAFTRAKDAEAATMVGVDRYGFELSVTTEKGPRPARIAFEEEVKTPTAARKALVALVKRAREGA